MSSYPHDDKDVKNSEDEMLHDTLTEIFGELSLTRSQTKELLRAPKNTDQDSMKKLILQRGRLPSSLIKIIQQESKLSLLWIALLHGYQNSAELLVRSGADVDERQEIKSGLLDEELTILHALLRMYPSSGNERLIRLLMEHGADLQARDSCDKTVLHVAVEEERLQMVELLLEKGARVNVADRNNETPLLTAAGGGKAGELVPLLLRHGADVMARDKRGNNVLHILASDADEEHVDLARVMIEKGVSLDDRVRFNQMQPIHMAVRKGKNELLKLFLDHGADVNALVKYARFPLYFAAQRKRPEVLLTLLKRGANIDMRTMNGDTALHGACDLSNISEDIVRLLLSVGADMMAEDRSRRTSFGLVFYTTRSDDPIVRLMLRTLALKKACQQPSIGSKDERLIQERPDKWNYYRACVEQIREMKSARFIESCTFFELLTKCQCRIEALMRNREFESEFRRYDLRVFSAYAEDIRRAFESARAYYRSVLEQENLINEAVYDALPHLVVRKVVRYVLDCDCELKKIVQASRKKSIA